jgi:hypothetical protein
MRDRIFEIGIKIHDIPHSTGSRHTTLNTQTAALNFFQSLKTKKPAEAGFL